MSGNRSTFPTIVKHNLSMADKRLAKIRQLRLEHCNQLRQRRRNVTK